MISIYRCATCQFAGYEQCPCNNGEWRYMSSKWRPPKKHNTHAWKRIANGELWWDRKAIDKKAKDSTEETRRVLEALKNAKTNLRMRNM
jgi:hypothetical protein